MNARQHNRCWLLIGGLVLAAAYWLFAGETSRHELIAGVIAWGAAAGFMIRAHRLAIRPLRPLRSGFLSAQVGTAVVTESYGAALILLRTATRGCDGSVGRLLRQPFRHGGSGTRDASRRALVTLTKSVAPGQFVVDVPEQGDLLWVHQLSPEPPSGDREWPL